MGTTKPLVVAVHESIIHSPEIKALRDKGHTVNVIASLTMYDVILGPNCWRMSTDLLPYVDLAIKQARALRYPKKEKVA